MKNTLKTGLCALALLVGTAAPQFAQDKMMGKKEKGTVMVGGAPMYPTKDIIDNAVNSKDHTTLVAAVKAAASCRLSVRRIE